MFGLVGFAVVSLGDCFVSSSRARTRMRNFWLLLQGPPACPSLLHTASWRDPKRSKDEPQKTCVSTKMQEQQLENMGLKKGRSWENAWLSRVKKLLSGLLVGCFGGARESHFLVSFELLLILRGFGGCGAGSIFSTEGKNFIFLCLAQSLSGCWLKAPRNPCKGALCGALNCSLRAALTIKVRE